MNDDNLIFYLRINLIASNRFVEINAELGGSKNISDGLPIIAIGERTFVDDDGSLREELIMRGMTPNAWCYAPDSKRCNDWGWLCVESSTLVSSDRFRVLVGNSLDADPGLYSA